MSSLQFLLLVVIFTHYREISSLDSDTPGIVSIPRPTFIQRITNKTWTRNPRLLGKLAILAGLGFIGGSPTSTMIPSETGNSARNPDNEQIPQSSSLTSSPSRWGPYFTALYDPYPIWPHVQNAETKTPSPLETLKQYFGALYPDVEKMIFGGGQNSKSGNKTRINNKETVIDIDESPVSTEGIDDHNAEQEDNEEEDETNDDKASNSGEEDLSDEDDEDIQEVDNDDEDIEIKTTKPVNRKMQVKNSNNNSKQKTIKKSPQISGNRRTQGRQRGNSTTTSRTSTIEVTTPFTFPTFAPTTPPTTIPIPTTNATEFPIDNGSGGGQQNNTINNATTPCSTDVNNGGYPYPNPNYYWGGNPQDIGNVQLTTEINSFGRYQDYNEINSQNYYNTPHFHQPYEAFNEQTYEHIQYPEQPAPLFDDGFDYSRRDFTPNFGPVNHPDNGFRPSINFRNVRP